MTTSTSPSAIFAAEPAARPRSAPQPERVGVALCEPKPQPVVEDFTEERDGERDHDRGYADRAEFGEPTVGEDAADHDPQAGESERDEDQPNDVRTDERNQSERGHVPPS